MNSPQQTVDLNQKFGIPGVANVVAGQGDLLKVVISAAECNGEMYLHGAHVTSWVPKNRAEVLYISPKSRWEDGRAIRGGVPVSFPWFADRADDPKAPAHGFVRTKSWELQSIELVDTAVVVTMFTQSDDETRRWWPFDFRLSCRASFGDELRIELTVVNTGWSSFAFEEALHAYFLAGDIERALVQGLDGAEFIDKTDERRQKRQTGDLRMSGETDRVYLNTQHELNLCDPERQRRVIVRKENSLTTVVWSPWAEKSAGMADLGAEDWREFVCIESSNVNPYAVELGAGEQHTMTSVLKVSSWTGSEA